MDYRFISFFYKVACLLSPYLVTKSSCRVTFRRIYNFSGGFTKIRGVWVNNHLYPIPKFHSFFLPLCSNFGFIRGKAGRANVHDRS